MVRQKRALAGVLAAVVVVTSLGSCTRRWRPAPTTTTTRPAPTTTAPGSTVHGRYVDKVFTDIDQVATAVTYKPAAANAGFPSDLKFDAWAPKGDTATKRPAVVWAFGGAFIAGDRTQMNSFAQDSARRGYVGITIDYRIQQAGSGIGSILNVAKGIVPAYLDMMAAGEYIKAHAAQYGIDPDAIVAAGFSAGAINAVNAVVVPGAELRPDAVFVPQGTVNPATTPYVAGISNSGASLGAIESAAGMGMSFSRPGQGPLIMFGGTADTIVSYQNWQVKSCDDHKAAGNVCEFHSYPGESHGVFAHVTNGEMQQLSAAFVMREVLSKKGYDAE